MAQSTVGIRIAVDAGQAQAQVSALADTVDKLNEKLAEATDAGDWTGAANITATINNLAMAQDNMARVPNNGQGGGGGGGQNAYNGNKNENDWSDRITNAIQSASSAAISFAHGDINGMASSVFQGAGSYMRNKAKAMEAEGNDGGLTNILKAGGIIGEIASAAINVTGAFSDQYESALSHMGGFTKLINPADINAIKAMNPNDTDEQIKEKQIQENNERNMSNFRMATQYAKDMGMTQEEFLDLAARETTFGKIEDTKRIETDKLTGKDIEVTAETASEKAMRYAQHAAQLANATGVDAETIQDLQGLGRRYGDKGNAADNALAALNASGAGLGQTREFIDAVRSAMEEGIDKGFLRSSKDVAANLAMVSKLSGESQLWTGEQAARRIRGMNDAISGATVLGDVGDAIMFNAADKLSESKKKEILGNKYTGTYIDTQMLLERGVSPQLMGALADTVQGLYGGNMAGQIEEYKRTLGLNYTGAKDVYDMMQKREADIKAEMTTNGGNRQKAEATVDASYANKIETMKMDPKFLDNETKMANAMADLHETVVGLGSGSFEAKVAGMSVLGNTVSKIYAFLTRGDKPTEQAIDILKNSQYSGEILTDMIEEVRNHEDAYKGMLPMDIAQKAVMKVATDMGKEGQPIIGNYIISEVLDIANMDKEKRRQNILTNGDVSDIAMGPKIQEIQSFIAKYSVAENGGIDWLKATQMVDAFSRWQEEENKNGKTPTATNQIKDNSDIIAFLTKIFTDMKITLEDK